MVSGLMAVVLAYNVLTTNDGEELRWETLNVPYAFNENGSSDLGQEVFPALEDGFQAWNDASGIDFEFDGCTSKGKSSVIDGSGNAGSDGSSIITWIESSWPYSPVTIAVTWTYFTDDSGVNPDDGVIGEADMLMNGVDYQWSTVNAGGQTDVASIAAHESGHYLGLGHSNVEDATMFPTTVQGDISLRTLHSDDIAGSRYLYGNGPSGGTFFNGECEGGGAGAGEGCDCSLSGGGATRGLLSGIGSVLALAIAGILTLRGRRAVPLVRTAAVAAAMLAVLLGARDASATVMLDQSLEQLAASSVTVLHGDVVAQEVETDGRTIQTVHRVRVREVVAGETRGELVDIVTPGGTLPDGRRLETGFNAMRAEGVPQFRVGEEVVLFAELRPDGRLTPTAWEQGALRVERAGAGTAIVTRRLHGIVRMERTETGMRPVVRDDLSGRTLDDVLHRIRVLPTAVDLR